jgi:hypothetical protein
MPRYLITIGNTQHPLARVSRPLIATTLRAAMTKAHRALLNARELTETGQDYNFWTVSDTDPDNGKLRPLRTYKLP